MKTNILSFGKISQWVWLLIVACAWMSSSMADVPVEEAPGTQLMKHQKKVKDYSDKNEKVDKQRLDLYIQRNEMEAAIDQTAQKMGKIQALMEYIEKLLKGDGSFDINYKPDKTALDELVQEGLSRVAFDPEYTVIDSKIIVEEVITKPPRWMDTIDSGKKEGEDGGSSFYSPRTKNLLVKVAAKVKSQVNREIRSSRMELMAHGMARDFFPDQLLNKFDARKVVSYLLGKAGVVELADGVTVRPAAPQDAAFVKYSNLNSDETEMTLFWSDPMVNSGYHPLFGTTLNRTILKGYKEVDMDNVISRGYSKKLDQHNMLQPSEKRTHNPFKGYAAKVMPGLIYMAQNGQIKDGSMPDNDQLATAMKYTKKLQMLPSQNMKIRKTSFNFSYPVRIIRVADEEGSGGDQTGVVDLEDLAKKVYEKSMLLAEKRLYEINQLKIAIHKARHYIDEVIQTLNDMEQQLNSISMQMNKQSAIPQISQLRKNVFDSLEHYRWALSKLEHQYDDLLHREWTILHHILDTRNKSVYELVSDASIRYRAAQHAVKSDESIKKEGEATDE